MSHDVFTGNMLYALKPHQESTMGMTMTTRTVGQQAYMAYMACINSKDNFACIRIAYPLPVFTPTVATDNDLGAKLV
jgi:hypothetical protein